MPTAKKKPAAKPHVYADVFPNVVFIHQGDRDSSSLKLVTHDQEHPARLAEILIKGLRTDHRVSVRNFDERGNPVK